MAQIAPQLLPEPGFGPLIAAKLVGEIAGAHRLIATRAAWEAWAPGSPRLR